MPRSDLQVSSTSIMAERKKLVLITGAAGTYGRILRTEWGDRYDVSAANLCDEISSAPRVPVLAPRVR